MSTMRPRGDDPFVNWDALVLVLVVVGFVLVFSIAMAGINAGR